jgi:hypothetical protein
MRIINNTVEVKSIPYWYNKEMIDKRYTIRIIDKKEVKELQDNKVPDFIRIVNTKTNEFFERQVLDISILGNIAGHQVIGICWE